MRVILWAFALGFGLFLLACPARAKGPDLDGVALGSIEELYVMVWDLADDVEADGLSLEKLRSDAEQLLATAGIEFVTTRDYAYALHKGGELPPSLVIDVHTLQIAPSTYVANLELEVWAPATLLTDQSVGVRQATVWRAPAVLTTVTKAQIATLHEEVKKLISRFIKEYWEVRLQS